MSDLDRRWVTYLIVGGLLYFAFLRARPASSGTSEGVLIDPTTGVPVTPDWWVSGGGGGGAGRPQLL